MKHKNSLTHASAVEKYSEYFYEESKGKRILSLTKYGAFNLSVWLNLLCKQHQPH